MRLCVPSAVVTALARSLFAAKAGPPKAGTPFAHGPLFFPEDIGHSWDAAALNRRALSELGLLPGDGEQILWACAALRVPAPLPDYMQDFIAFRLDAPAPATATRVRRLTPDQLERLGELIRRGQQAR